MKAKETYLKGKFVFTISLIVIGITILTVYLSGINYNRSITSNLYLSLSIIGICLFVFMTYGLYKGMGVADDPPEEHDFNLVDLLSLEELPDVPIVEFDDGIGGTILSIFFWLAVTVFIISVLITFVSIFWSSLLIILTMLYWVFFRALKLVFSKSNKTKENLIKSLLYSLGYTILFTGWIFGISYFVETFS